MDFYFTYNAQMKIIEDKCNTPIAKTAIWLNVIMPARDSCCTTSRNTPAGRSDSGKTEKICRLSNRKWYKASFVKNINKK